MTRPEDLEERVAAFLERSEREPALSPTEFASAWPAEAADLEEAIRRTLAVRALFPSAQDAMPARIGRYEIVRELGRGGMGIVVEARRGTERRALKLLPPQFLHGPKTAARFRRECQVLQRLDHPHVVRLLDHDLGAQRPYLVLELVEGETLAATTRPIDAPHLVERLARAVHAAHEHGVLHRDLKPQNVMLRPDGSPILLDFGLVADEHDPSITSTDEVLGTPRYMAPEQVRGEPATVRTDVHGLGMLLYEVSVGRPVRLEDTRAGVLRAALAGRIVPPRRLVPGYPRALERVVLTALARDPRDRYPSAEALADDLARLIAGEPVRARPPGPVKRLLRGVRAHPVRPAIALVVSALLAVAWWAPHRTNSAPPASRAALERHLDRATAAFLHNHRAHALGELRRAGTLAPDDPEVRALETLFAAETLDELRASGLGTESAFGAALEAHRLRRANELGAARALLDTAHRRHPASLALLGELAELDVALGAFDDARTHLEACIALEPLALHPRERLALFCSARDQIADAVDVAVRIQEEGVSHVVQALLDRLGPRSTVIEALRALLGREPQRRGAHRALAYACDSEHRVREAAEHYERTLALDPADGDVLAWLANLQAGGDRGSCPACDRAFADAPELVDPARAEARLVQLARLDRGATPRFTSSLLYVAHKLPTSDALRAELRTLLEGSDLASEQTENLTRVLRSLESRRPTRDGEARDG